ncbi:hypothetical protein ACU686_09875 [Yinghuangia aomiensis]
MTAPDFRTPALDALAQEIIPAQHFEFSAATARDRFFKPTPACSTSSSGSTTPSAPTRRRCSTT